MCAEDGDGDQGISDEEALSDHKDKLLAKDSLSN